MKKSLLSITTTILFLILFGVIHFGIGPTIASAEQKVIKWKLQGTFGTGSLEYKYWCELFTKRVEEASAGRLKITAYPAGSLVGTMQLFDAVSKGAIDICQQWGAYLGGKDPAFILESVAPLGWQTPMQALGWIYNGGGLELERELYSKYNVHYVGPLVGNHNAPWGGLFLKDKAVHKISDLKGLKLRSSGADAKLLSKVGVATVSLPGEESYLALERGTIDGAEYWSPYHNANMGMHQIVKYVVYWQNWRECVLANILVNKQKWDSLPSDLQAILEQVTNEVALQYAAASGIESLKALERMRKEGVIIIDDWDVNEIKRFRSIAKKIWNETGNSSTMAKKINESMQKTMKLYGILP